MLSNEGAFIKIVREKVAIVNSHLKLKFSIRKRRELNANIACISY